MIIDSDTTLAGSTDGEVTVRPGVTLSIDGTHDGSIELEGDAELVVLGALNGRLEIGSLGTARVAGAVVGPVEIRVAGTLVIEPGGTVTGQVTNYGSFTNLGTRVGYVEGRAPDDRPGSSAS